jgi:hypothetical protein
MKLLDNLPRRGIKYIIFAYVFISLVYTGSRFYNITDTFHPRTERRSVDEPIDVTTTRDTFFIAPLAREIIESDEYEELVKNYVKDHQDLPIDQKSELLKHVTMSKGRAIDILFIYRIFFFLTKNKNRFYIQLCITRKSLF